MLGLNWDHLSMLLSPFQPLSSRLQLLFDIIQSSSFSFLIKGQTPSFYSLVQWVIQVRVWSTLSNEVAHHFCKLDLNMNFLWSFFPWRLFCFMVGIFCSFSYLMTTKNLRCFLLWNKISHIPIYRYALKRRSLDIKEQKQKTKKQNKTYC